ncbi:hypothetical protein [Nonomuraea endophytica]|uniref:Putative nucleic acid-binding protein n=1 Tax=Nonomuraea endophytica TaxID=714136 RepID=A0A7W8ECU4_9ACTN|nr:hypothetical protein [Nonomuraea endophytica]MBB5074636.1 putative nucleic acid-binding protein [Nonomuraea endophytica]
MAKTETARAVRMETLAAAVDFDALPFDAEAAARYGTLVALTVAAKRDPRPRRLDLMIAAVASVHGLPLYTHNTGEFIGLEDLVVVVPI